jgi:protein gp37
MAEKTAIGWTHHSFNPWWGCSRVSPGCQHCFAETFAHRLGKDLWGKGAERRFFGDKHWAEPLKWNRQAEAEGRRHRVFCASMADVFENRPDLDEHRARLWALIDETPWLDWQLLTKRPENVGYLMPARWEFVGWPPNVWLGTTVEDQVRADERVPVLCRFPAAVRFLSCEPLIGPVTLDHWLVRCRHDWANPEAPRVHGECEPGGIQPGVDWVIVGGESGPGARPMLPVWALSLLRQCDAAGVPAFFKQAGRVLGHEWGCSDGHGADWSSWPEWARRREFPTSVAAQ